ncbi:quaternary amine ABC transporter ATP-binding protein [Clostridium peptidivorans]|uniref:quaternary amine ABC transporter ATP-binding protein n=1 Tax=Clostridium peptidivorans TaxID=100174 RepID=UPI000BE3C1E0|nr:glycine betaine/L-proline ABC transporter ATP-binding protein [Clostridium peptidivorans]
MKIEVKNLYKVFGKNSKKVIPLLEEGMDKEEILKKTGNSVGVNNASFHVDEGEFFVIMGLSGSGKSTLIRCLNRLIEPTSGEILIDGQDILKCNEEELREIRRKKMAMVFQNFGLLPHRNVCKNVEFGLEIQGVDEKIRTEEAYKALELVGLKGYEEKMPHELSGGMQQRVGLARGLATEPEILLMDEAFSALDPLIRKDMQQEMIELQSKMRKTIIFITHDLDEALRLGDRIAIMKDGVIEQIGTPEDILANPASEYVRKFTQDVDRTKVMTAGAIMQRTNVIILSKDGPKAAARAMEEQGISSIYVTDKDRTLQGIVKIDDAIESYKKGEKDISNIIIKEVAITSPEASIAELLPIAKDISFPIAVVDKDNKMMGIIKRSTIIAGIIGEEEYR